MWLEISEASARTRPGDKYYRASVELAKGLAKHNLAVITGGGPGIMEAANKGAALAKGRSVGLNIELPFEQKSNPVINGNSKTVTYKYFFNRKVAFIKEANAVVLFPGGFGTMDELFETLTLIQTGKIKPVPVLLFGQDHWRRAIDFDWLVEQGMITEGDLGLFHFVESAEEAWEVIRAFYNSKEGR